MTRHSLPPEVLHRFIAGTATPEERREVARHLLSGCHTCSRFLQGFLSPVRPDLPSIGPSYDDVFEKVQELTSSTVDEPRRLYYDLLAHPTLRQEILIKNHPRYWTTRFGDFLITESHQLRFTNRGEMLRLSRWALLVAEKLGSQKASPEEILTYKVRAYMAYGNSLRTLGALDRADKALSKAAKFLDRNDIYVSLRAELLAYLSSLRFDQQHYEASLDFAEQEISLRRDLYAPGDLGRSLMQHAMSVGEGGHPSKAIEILEEASRIASRASDPRLALIIQHCSIRFHLDAGYPDRALCLYRAAEPSYGEVRDPHIHAKAAWLKGQILAARGELREAFELIRYTRKFFLERENSLEASVASLDLALILLKKGQKSRARRLAAAALREFQTQGRQRDYLAAIILLRQAS